MGFEGRILGSAVDRSAFVCRDVCVPFRALMIDSHMFEVESMHIEPSSLHSGTCLRARTAKDNVIWISFIASMVRRVAHCRAVSGEAC